MATADSQRPRSLNNNIPTYIQFVNCTGRMVYLFWLDYNGKLVRYGHIPPRRGMSMNTFVTHPWIARDAATWYPLLLNGKQILYPEAERGEHIFHDLDRDRIDIHIPVYPLFRRCLEVVYMYFQRETIAWSNIPKNIKDILFNMSPPTEFNDYALFDRVIYDNLHGQDDDLQENNMNNNEAEANDNNNRGHIDDDVNVINDEGNHVQDGGGEINDINNPDDNNLANGDNDDDDDDFHDLENDNESDDNGDDICNDGFESEKEDYYDACEEKSNSKCAKRPK